MWKKNTNCGQPFYLMDLTPAQCDPEGENPCCDDYKGGTCGNTTEHCLCEDCTDYRIVHRDWKESEGKQKWKYNGKCGKLHPQPDGTPSECDPDGEKYCCSDDSAGGCGNTEKHCNCSRCKDYKFLKKWRESGGKLKWRSDGRCGIYDFLPDGSPAECDPEGENPCCNDNGYCSSADRCFCRWCIDYKIVKKVREAEENCTIVRLFNGFLKQACFDESIRRFNFKCIFSDVHYKLPIEKWHSHGYYPTILKSEICQNDPYVYQACGLTAKTETKDREALCGSYICEIGDFGIYKQCIGEACRNVNRNCDRSSESDFVVACDDKCDEECCEDESDCSGFKYASLTCKDPSVSSCANLDLYDLIPEVCLHDEFEPSIITCNSYIASIENGHEQLSPIVNYTRCTVLNVLRQEEDLPVIYPYCSNYLDQTNCTDIERVGGYCLVRGFLTSVSKFVVCYAYDTIAKVPFKIKICDDDFQNECVTDTKTGCTVHKHRMCDHEDDCSDGSDENHDMCRSVQKKNFEFNCTRSFNPKYGNGLLPLSWIMDGTVDCMNGEDEDEDSSKWKLCKGLGDYRKIIPPNQNCQNAFKCPGSQKFYVPFDQLCDGVESCGDGGENEVCRIARDFPPMNKSVSYKNGARNVCQKDVADCKVKEFTGLWGEIDVFGVTTKSELLVPASKINCKDLFGEEYLFLSCMDLCSEVDLKCPLDDMTDILKYNSCPGQFPDRTYTIANNSFLVFVENSEKGHYHQEFFECKNSKCVEYKQVCDLVDDCGDMSDELNCINHMICEDTLNSTKHQFIALSQKCDGIYDCFDLSDECNDGCGREILENWALKIICWFMGTLALLFNSFTMTQEFASIKECKTENMLTSKVLMGLIGLGDCLIGLYLMILSIYDSIIMGKDFCVRQAEWLTGKACLTLGVISTFGSQISLFTMAVLSFIRMYGLIFKAMRVPGPVNKKAVLRVLSLTMATITVALSIAVVPLAPFLEDYFVQGMYYDPAYKVFVGFPNKERHIKILQTYENITRNATTIPTDMSWEEIGIRVDKMFSQDHGTLGRIPVHFYGNDGLCLFKFFVRTDDARRSRQPEAAPLARGDPVVWTILAVNFFCFLIITCCYIVINIQTKKSSKRSGQKGDRSRLKSERAIQNKIMIIIATDFLCWVPFILTSALHSFETIDASKWYTSFSMTVLPLNSVINPLVYDKALGDLITVRLAKLRSFIRGLLNMSDEEQEQDQENIPIETICSNLTIHNPTATSADAVDQQDSEETM